MSGAKITILMYHSVSTEPDPYTVSPEAFAAQVEFIRHNYTVVRLRDVATHLDARGDRKVIVTFDDAFVDFVEHAQEVLRRHSIPATVFVPTAFIGGWNSWDHHNPHVARRRVMNTQQLGSVVEDDLIDIGSHTVDHVCMRGLSIAEMRRQAAASRTVLEKTLQRPVRMFSYPYGQLRDFSHESEQVLSDAGYDVGVTTCWGTRHSAREILRLRRVSLATADDLSTIRAKIEGLYDWIGTRSYVGFKLRSAVGLTAHRH